VAREEHAAVVRVGHEHVGLLQDAVDIDLGRLTGLLRLEEVDRLAGEARQRGEASQILLGHGLLLVRKSVWIQSGWVEL
jgi:uncharacterized protein with PIN domain